MKKVLILFLVILVSGCTEQIERPLEKQNKGIIVKQSGGMGLLVAECADRDYIVERSDYIIEGKVENVESKWNEEETSIVTYTDLLIENYVKGVPFGENNFQIVTPGGSVDGVTLTVEDQPIFHKGRKVRVYFQKFGGEFSIVCAQFGIEEIITEECKIDDDCAPEQCCHATSCVLKENRQDCGEIVCTMECAPGSLDCGQGSCECVNGKCGAVFN